MSRTPEKRHSHSPARGIVSMNNSLDNSTPHKASSHSELRASKVLAVRAAITAEMENTWVAGGADYLDGIIRSESSLNCIKKFIKESSLYEDRRWTDIPTRPTKESELYAPATAIVTAVLEHFGRSSARRAVDSHSIKMRHGSVDEELYSSPDMVIVMNGKIVDPDTPADDVASETAQGPETEQGPETNESSETDESLQTDQGSGDDYMPKGKQYTQPSNHHSRFADTSYKNVATFIEIKQDSMRSSNEFRPQIAIYARELFIQQHNRQHVFGMLLTERTAEVYQFDRAGAIYTSRVDIHEDPYTFVRMILCITSMDHQALGFDDSIYWAAGERYLKIRDVEYIIVGGQPVFLRRSIRGRGTTCWIVKIPGSKMNYFIKDYWKAEARPYESDYLLDAVGIVGVAQMIDYANKKSSISAQRKAVQNMFVSDDDSNCVISDRELCRLVMKNGGRPIDHFPDTKQLLSIMSDAINAHQSLFKKRILHRDVSMMNVLVCPTDSPGKFRGVLVDLDLAVRLDREETLAKCDYRTGTRLYQSIHVLRAQGQHDHMDDLESFFYLLCILCLGYSGPNRPIVPTPPFLARWEQDDPAVAADLKMLFTSSNPKLLKVSLVISPRSSKVLSDMISRLLAFVQKRVKAKAEKIDAREIAIMEGEKADPPVVINPEFMVVADEEYSEFLGIISDATDELEQAEPESFRAPYDSSVDLSENIGFGPRSFMPVPEMPVESGSGSKRGFESEQTSEPARKRTRSGKLQALPTS